MSRVRSEGFVCTVWEKSNGTGLAPLVNGPTGQVSNYNSCQANPLGLKRHSQQVENLVQKGGSGYFQIYNILEGTAAGKFMATVRIFG